MEDPKTEFKTLEDFLNSPYFKYLASEKINDEAKRKWKILQWFVYAILGVLAVAGIRTFLDYQYIQNTKEKVDTLLVQIERERDSVNEKHNQLQQRLQLQDMAIAFQSEKLSIQDKKMSIQDRAFDQGNSYSKLYYQIFSDQLEQTKTLRTGLEKNREEISNYSTLVGNKIQEYKNEYENLKSYRNSIENRISIIESIEKQNFYNSSLRYVYAERSDRLNETFNNPYKPSVYSLPGKTDTLTFVFYKVNNSKVASKQVLIDVYRNKVKLERSPLEITEKNGTLLPSRIPLEIGNDTYLIEPAFIYLPTNTIPFILQPDFVVLKISLAAS